MTVSANAKMLYVLAHLRSLVLDGLKPPGHGDLDQAWDCGPHSSFVDVGSGYGKVNFHAKVMCGVRRSLGIECVYSRYQIAASILQNVKEKNYKIHLGIDPLVLIPEYKKHLEKPTSPPLDLVSHPAAASSSPTDGEAPPKPKKLKKELTEEERSRRKREAGIKFKEEMAQLAEVHANFDVDGVEFKHADGTMEPLTGYDHIYMFDRVFSRACDFRVLVSSRHWREWWGLGLPKVQPVAKIRMATTGKEKARSSYVYINSDLFPMPEGTENEEEEAVAAEHTVDSAAC